MANPFEDVLEGFLAPFKDVLKRLGLDGESQMKRFMEKLGPPLVERLSKAEQRVDMSILGMQFGDHITQVTNGKPLSEFTPLEQSMLIDSFFKVEKGLRSKDKPNPFTPPGTRDSMDTRALEFPQLERKFDRLLGRDL